MIYAMSFNKRADGRNGAAQNIFFAADTKALALDLAENLCKSNGWRLMGIFPSMPS